MLRSIDKAVYAAEETLHFLIVDPTGIANDQLERSHLDRQAVMRHSMSRCDLIEQALGALDPIIDLIVVAPLL
ncbi:MAG TPA: hypothetical protein VGJ20_37710 [Xanthobacteraceae bacterium]